MRRLGVESILTIAFAAASASASHMTTRRAIGALPGAQSDQSASSLPKRHFFCDNPVQGLLREDCEHMSSIGMSEQGINALSNNGRIWIGNKGPNKLTFTNRVNLPITVVVWYFPVGDYQASFVNARQPDVTYSLPTIGDSVVVSVEDRVSGGFAALYDRSTPLSPNGQVYNTWGEFTTGPYATINVSREPNMRGNGMEIRTGGGCVSNMDTCVFKCKSGVTCGEEDTYYLQNCDPGSQDGNPHIGYDSDRQPSGGCGGWGLGGVAQIDFLN